SVQHFKENQYVKFTPADPALSPFFGFWQPCVNIPAPLIVHVPGYGANIVAHPDLQAQGYSVLEISPRGYDTPQGFDKTQMLNGIPSVLQDTMLSEGKRGYGEWLLDCVLAVRWA